MIQTIGVLMLVVPILCIIIHVFIELFKDVGTKNGVIAVLSFLWIVASVLMISGVIR